MTDIMQTDEPPVRTYESLLSGGRDWQERLATVVNIMRELSAIDDPRELVDRFGGYISRVITRDRSMVLSRRGVPPHHYLITRFSEWENAADPWTERHKLPLLEGGILGELIYSNEPRLINNLELEPDDPAYPYLEGMHSLLTMPHYDHGEAMTMTMLLRAEPHAFNPEALGEYVWTANLFGRAVHTLRLSDELEKANAALDLELDTVSNIQRSLLPERLPDIPGVELAAHYETAQHAGGDYYDFFPIAGGRHGILVADVCGHGASAAVLMAMSHAIAHTCPDCSGDPAAFLGYINERLYANYTRTSKAFVTAFYGVYDPRTRRIEYASAGHPSPRILTGNGKSIEELRDGLNLPLGVNGAERYSRHEHVLRSGDAVLFYTDGVTETRHPQSGQFGIGRLDEVLRRRNGSAQALIDSVVTAVAEFADTRRTEDDRTLLAMKLQ